MSPRPLPQLSPRAERTRSALIAAGFELLVERPIEGIAIDELVAKAGVAKGSFFNHFRDKHELAGAIGAEVRRELEELVAYTNSGIEDPIKRLVGGMRVAAEFAINHPKRSAVLLRSDGGSTSRDHPLNKGLREDIEAACAQGLVRSEAKDTGVLYWLGLCHILMMSLIESQGDEQKTARLLAEMTVLGLTGLGVPESQSRGMV